jgi:DNA mismatch endonuclease (patch repair protein)
VRPDFVFRAQRIAVFVDGCFWHGCPIHATPPKQNAKFWRDKIAGNRARDRPSSRQRGTTARQVARSPAPSVRAGSSGRSLGEGRWRVLRVWEHELARKHEARLVARLLRHLGLPEPIAARVPRSSRLTRSSETAKD